MIICKVKGHVWATKKEDTMVGLKLMVVQELKEGCRRRLCRGGCSQCRCRGQSARC